MNRNAEGFKFSLNNHNLLINADISTKYIINYEHFAGYFWYLSHLNQPEPNNHTYSRSCWATRWKWTETQFWKRQEGRSQAAEHWESALHLRLVSSNQYIHTEIHWAACSHGDLKLCYPGHFIASRFIWVPFDIMLIPVFPKIS